jgi:hypothetical protein
MCRDSPWCCKKRDEEEEGIEKVKKMSENTNQCNRVQSRNTIIFHSNKNREDHIEENEKNT